MRPRASRVHAAGDDSGAITVLAAAIVGLVTATSLAVAAAAGVLVERHRLGAAADAAALAAADVASGLVGGIACDAAERLAWANRARLTRCLIEGSEATVRVTSTVGPFALSAAATAGQPPLS